MKRSMHLFPKQGDREPWLNTQDYGQEKKMIRHGTLDDGVLTFTKADRAAAAEPVTRVAAE